MRTAIAIVLLLTAQAQRHSSEVGVRPCPAGGQGLDTYWYYKAVLDQIRPPDWARYSLTISFSPKPQTKLILRTNGEKFELSRGEPDTNVSDLLEALDRACRLPPNPADAADMIKVNWENAEVSAGDFGRLHSDFTAALSRYTTDIQMRYASVLSEGGVIHLHTPEYSIVYDNHGFEHIEVEAWDETGDPVKMNPLIKWVHAILKLNEKSFPRK